MIIYDLEHLKSISEDNDYKSDCILGRGITSVQSVLDILESFEQKIAQFLPSSSWPKIKFQNLSDPDPVPGTDWVYY